MPPKKTYFPFRPPPPNQSAEPTRVVASNIQKKNTAAPTDPVMRPTVVVSSSKPHGPRPCRISEQTISASEVLVKKRNGLFSQEDLLEVVNDFRRRPTSGRFFERICNQQNFCMLDKKTIENMQTSWNKVKWHLIAAATFRQMMEPHLPNCDGVVDEIVVKRGKLNVIQLRQFFGAFCNVIQLKHFLGEDNVCKIVAAASQAAEWPIGYPLLNNWPQLKLKEILWLRKAKLSEDIPDAKERLKMESTLRCAIRDWVALFFIRLLLHAMRRTCVVVAGNRALYYSIFPQNIYNSLRRVGFDRYQHDGDTVRLEEIPPRQKPRVVRNLWTVVEGKKTRPIATLSDSSVKLYEKQLNSLLRCCLDTWGNHMRDCEQILSDIRVRLGDKQRYVFKTDITKCYDNIYLDRLIEIVERTIRRRFAEKNASTATVMTFKKGKNIKIASHFSIDEAWKRLRKQFTLPGDIPAKLEEFTLTEPKTADEILAGIREMLAIPIESKSRIYKQMRGIPQGSALSTTLCYLYVTEMLEQAIPGGMCGVDVLYYVDDVVIIDTDLERIQQAASNLLNGVMGLKASEKKTAANFAIPNRKIKQSDVFEWTVWQFTASALDPVLHHRLARRRLSIMRRHSRFGNVRRIAKLMQHSGRLHRLPRNNLRTKVLGDCGGLSLYGDLSRAVLPSGLHKRFYLRRRGGHLGLSSVIRRDRKIERRARLRRLALRREQEAANQKE